MSSPKLILAQKHDSVKLGEILKEAHLISLDQLHVALLEQSFYPEKRLGEILAEQGRINQQTADFFAERWTELLIKVNHHPKQTLGEYLLEAGLLSQSQITEILEEQGKNRLWHRFGAIAALKGWIPISTIDFFLDHLFPEYADDSPFTKPKN